MTKPQPSHASVTTVHVVPHTHWDREWYRPFQSFRMQLVELVDQVLEMLAADPRFSFTLDGQLATVDDYLAVRPEAEDRIRRVRALRPPGDRPLADPDGRIPVLGRDDDPQPRDGNAAGDGAGRRHAGRLPARHVRARGPDATAPARRRDRYRSAVAGRPGGDRRASVQLVRAGRFERVDGVPGRGVRQRCPPLRPSRTPQRQAAAAPRPAAAVLRRRPAAGDVRQRPHRSAPGSDGGRRRAERRAPAATGCRSTRWRSTSQAAGIRAQRSNGTESCARRHAPTC